MVYDYAISPAPREPILTDTGELRRSWGKWFQDVVDGLNSHQGSIVAIPTSVGDQVTINYVQERQKYHTYYEYECDGTEGNHVTLPSSYLTGNLIVILDRRHCHAEEHLNEVYYEPVLDDDGLYRRVRFLYNGEAFNLSAGVIVGFYWMAA